MLEKKVGREWNARAGGLGLGPLQWLASYKLKILFNLLNPKNCYNVTELHVIFRSLNAHFSNIVFPNNQLPNISFCSNASGNQQAVL